MDCHVLFFFVHTYFQHIIVLKLFPKQHMPPFKNNMTVAACQRQAYGTFVICLQFCAVWARKLLCWEYKNSVVWVKISMELTPISDVMWITLIILLQCNALQGIIGSWHSSGCHLTHTTQPLWMRYSPSWERHSAMAVAHEAERRALTPQRL